MGQIRVRLNVPLLGHAAGTELLLPAKEDGSPAELFWRRRLRDATRSPGGDGCVTVVASEAAPGSVIVPASETAAGGGGGE
jgi:hypothetical protein